MSYIPLHLHSCISDGLQQPKQIVNRLVELGLPGGCLLDHGSVSGFIEFYKEGKEKIAPICGNELYCCGQSATIKTNENKSLTHIPIIALNTKGYKQLLKITSESNRADYFYYKPRLSLEELGELWTKDLMAFSGHIGSVLADSIINNGTIIEDWKKTGCYVANYLKELFSNNFMLEAQLFDCAYNKLMGPLTECIREIAQQTKIPIIATPDAHYNNREDTEDHRIIVCKKFHMTLQQGYDSDISFFHSKEAYLPSYDDMLGFGHTLEELENTLKILDEYEPYDILQSPQLPHYETPPDISEKFYLRQLCELGLKQRRCDDNKYRERLNKELSAIEEPKLEGYFLIVKDILDYVRKNKWLPGPGRGSSSGCLISYLINITDIDPIKYSLIFERFYNKARKNTIPDIDIDVPADCRDAIIEYLKEKYGIENVAQIITWTNLKGREALKECLRARSNVSFDEMNRMSKHIPDESKIADDLQIMKEEGLEPSIILWALREKPEEFNEWVTLRSTNPVELDGPFKEEFAQAIRIEGTKAAQSRHAAGIVISPKPLYEYCPLIYDAKNNFQLAGYEMDDLESVGLVKFDILGLATLDKIQYACEIEKTCGPIYN